MPWNISLFTFHSVHSQIFCSPLLRISTTKLPFLYPERCHEKKYLGMVTLLILNSDTEHKYSTLNGISLLTELPHWRVSVFTFTMRTPLIWCQVSSLLYIQFLNFFSIFFFFWTHDCKIFNIILSLSLSLSLTHSLSLYIYIYIYILTK